MGPIVCEYPYRPRWTVIVFCGAFFTLGAALLGYRAAQNDRGLVIRQLIELDPQQATWFFGFLSAMCFGAVAVTGIMLYWRLSCPRRVLLGEQGITVPKSVWSADELEIPYSDVTEVRVLNAGYGTRFLQFRHAAGKVGLLSDMFPSQSVFEELCGQLTAHAAAARSRSNG